MVTILEIKEMAKESKVKIDCFRVKEIVSTELKKDKNKKSYFKQKVKVIDGGSDRISIFLMSYEEKDLVEAEGYYVSGEVRVCEYEGNKYLDTWNFTVKEADTREPVDGKTKEPVKKEVKKEYYKNDPKIQDSIIRQVAFKGSLEYVLKTMTTPTTEDVLKITNIFENIITGKCYEPDDSTMQREAEGQQEAEGVSASEIPFQGEER